MFVGVCTITTVVALLFVNALGVDSLVTDPAASVITSGYKQTFRNEPIKPPYAGTWLWQISHNKMFNILE